VRRDAENWRLTLIDFGLALKPEVLHASVSQPAASAQTARGDSVAGTLLAFFCFNAGIVALVRPVPVEPAILRFYLLVCAVTVLAITLVMLTGEVP
jgi:Ca2+/Na+ antiporter